MNEHQELRAMSLAERLAWMKSRTRYAAGLWLVKVDGRLAAMGTEEESPDLVAKFLMCIARPARPQRTGGMG